MGHNRARDNRKKRQKRRRRQEERERRPPFERMKLTQADPIDPYHPLGIKKKGRG